MKRISLLLIILFSTMTTWAQNPKWLKKARKSQLTILVYDDKDNMRQGQGFYLNEEGQIVTDYDLVKGATKVSINTTDNKAYTATRLAGANSLYNVVKLNTDSKKASPLTQTQTAVMKGDIVYIMPLPTEKDGIARRDTIVNVEKFETDYAYYKLSGTPDDRLVGNAVMNEAGEVIGMLQVSGSGTKKAAYALSINYADRMQTTALDVNNADLKSIGIPILLPNDESQAASFLYLISNTNPSFDTYANDFIERYPKSSTGYIQKAEGEVARGYYGEAETTYSQAVKAKTDKEDEIHYSFARSLYGVNVKGIKDIPETWTLQRAIDEVKSAKAIKDLPIYTAMEGYCLYASKNYDEAFTAFNSLGSTNLRSAEFFFYAAQCKEKMEAPKEEVLALQDSAVATFTKPYPIEAANYLMLRAQTLKEMERYREAVIDYNEYEHLTMKGLTANFYYEREQLELKCRMLEQALADINHAVTLDPKEPFYRAEQAAVNYRGGFFDESIAACKEAIKLDDTFADAYRIWGMCLKQKGDKKGAKDQLQKAIDHGDEVAKKLILEL